MNQHPNPKWSEPRDLGCHEVTTFCKSVTTEPLRSVIIPHMKTSHASATDLTPRRRDAKMQSKGRSIPAPVRLYAFAFLLAPVCLWAATNDLSGLLQRGLFEEEANRNLEAATAAYETLVKQFDKDRQIGATAVFRLGEVYRKQGKTNEAVLQYERIIRDFAEQTTLVTLSKQNLTGLRPKTTAQSGSLMSLEELRSRIDVARMRVAVLEALPTTNRAAALAEIFSNDEIIESLNKQLVATEIQLATLRQSHSENHPDVKTALAQVESIQKQLDARATQLETGQRLILDTLEKAMASRTPASLEKLQATGVATGDDAEGPEIRRLQILIQNSPDLINGPAEGESPLYNAAGAGQLRVATFLLDNGANVNKVSVGRTPLHNAVQFGHKGMVELLLQRGANVEARDGTGGTALHLAAQSGFLSIAEVLLKHKADVHARNNQSNREKTPLHLAVAGGHRVMSEFLVQHGADVNLADASGCPPGFEAVWRGHSDLLARLLALGAKPDVEDNAGRTALSYAADRGHLESVKALLAAKADPNAGRTDLPLHRAIHSRSPAIVELLLRADADANRVAPVSPRAVSGRMNPGYTGSPLEAAVLEADAGLVQLLLQFKADPNGPSSTKEPFVVSAANNSAILKLLLEAGAKPDAVNPNIDGAASALHTAISNGNRESVRLLLEHGAKPNMTALYGHHGVTPLMMAASRGDAEIAELLLKHKADPKPVDARGNTALLNAVLQKSPEVVRALLAGGANPDTTHPGDYPVLMIAVTDAANREVVAALLAGKANVNAPDPNGKTPLHWAAETRRQDLVELLIQAGADVNLRDKAGKTALDYAKQGTPPGGAVALRPPLPGVPMPVAGGFVPQPGSLPQATTESTPADVAALLRQHGALDELPDFTRISVSRASSGYRDTVFTVGTNNWSRYTLTELIAQQLRLLSTQVQGTWTRPRRSRFDTWAANPIRFPDFSQITIHRPSQDGKSRSRIPVVFSLDPDASGKHTDWLLEPGDMVEIPEADRPVSETWLGPMEPDLAALTNAIARTVTLIIGGKSSALKLAPAFAIDRNIVPEHINLTSASFMLRSVLDESKLVRFSSDLTRVKVTRAKGPSGKRQEWVVDCSGGNVPFPDLWLQDGDVIEVPDKP